MNLSENIKKIGEDILSSHTIRVKDLDEIISYTHEKLEGFSADLKRFSSEQSDYLSHFIKDLSNNSENMLQEFQSSRKAMADNLKAEAEELKKNLKDSNQSRIEISENFRKGLMVYMNSLSKYVGDMSGNVQKMLEDYRTDNMKARQIWSNLTESKRGVRPKAIHASSKAVTSDKPVSSMGKPVSSMQESAAKKKTMPKSRKAA